MRQMRPCLLEFTVLWEVTDSKQVIKMKGGGEGVPVVAQRLTNLTRIHEATGSIPGLTQWVEDPVWP